MCDFKKLAKYSAKIFLSVSEVADLLGVSEETVRQMARSERLPGEQTDGAGRWIFRSRDIKGFCEGRSFLHNITPSTQVLWVRWDERIPAADWCNKLKNQIENIIRNSENVMQMDKTWLGTAKINAAEEYRWFH